MIVSFLKEKLPWKKRFQKFPNVIILLIGIVLIMTILTYIIPAGAYEREVNDAGRTVVVNGTFQFLDEQTPVGLMDFLSAFHNGFLNGADIIMLVLACGGSFIKSYRGFAWKTLQNTWIQKISGRTYHHVRIRFWRRSYLYL